MKARWVGLVKGNRVGYAWAADEDEAIALIREIPAYVAVADSDIEARVVGFEQKQGDECGPD